jgi:ribosome biogenesis GTPase
VIERVEPRRGVLSRVSQRREHVLVATVDQALIVTSAADPPPKLNFVNRFLLSAAKGDVRAIVCVNKIDLVERAQLEPLAGAYARLGYHALLVSAYEPSTLAQLKSLLAGKQTVLAGQSGVGKTSLLNALCPGMDLRVGEVSEDSRKGRHTTRAARLIALDDGGWIVDTPGIRELGLWGVLPEEVEGYFIELRPFVTLCKFPDCTHTHEQGCGVKQAVDERLISAARYESYVRIFQGDVGGDD